MLKLMSFLSRPGEGCEPRYDLPRVGRRRVRHAIGRRGHFIECARQRLREVSVQTADLLLSLKIAKSLGLDVPETLPALSDEGIERGGGN